MNIDRHLLAGVIGVSLILAACGGSSTATPTSPITPPVTTAPGIDEPTMVPGTDVPTDDGEPTDDGNEPSLVPGAASDLEANLPDEAAGVKYEKSSFDGASIGMFGANVDSEELDPILKANGKTINDVRVAIASPADSSSAAGGMVIAFQIRGLDASKFMEAMGVDVASMTRTTISGKEVLSSGTADFSFVVYAKGDVLYEILMANSEVTASILQQLP